MDPATAAIGLVASVIQIIQVTMKGIEYLNTVKDAPKERASLARESANLLSLLTNLRYKMEDADPADIWFSRLRALGGETGPLEQYKIAMERLARKLKSERNPGKWASRLVWSLEKKEIKQILDQIERLKTLIGLALQEDNFILSLAIKKTVEEANDNVLDIAAVLKDQHISEMQYRLNKEQQRVLAWLSPLNFASKQIDVFDRREEGTGQWLLDSSAFKAWLDGTEPTLCCYGLAGAGKTILTSIVVDYLQHHYPQDDTIIIYIYLSYNDYRDQSFANLMGSLLQQVIQKKQTVSTEIVSLYHSHIASMTRPAASEFSKLLHSEMRNFSNAFLIVDAVDEYYGGDGTRDSFLTELHKLTNQLQVHLIMTSRHLAVMKLYFIGAASLEIRASDEDIRTYVKARLVKERRLELIRSDLLLQESIIETVVDNAKGMFLLAQLHMDSLARKHNKRDVRLALKNLPEGIDDTCDEAMKRVNEQNPEDAQLAKRMLAWLSYASRPLTVQELQHALAIEPGTSSLDEEALSDEDYLVSLCAGLATIDQESRVIRLMHYTTQEYFLYRSGGDHFPTAKLDIPIYCLTYLLYDEFLGFRPFAESRERRRHTNSLQRRYPFFSYAAMHWGYHVRGDSERDPIVQSLTLRLLSQKSTLSLLESTRNGFYHNCFSALHVAASYGLVTIAEKLSLNEANIHAVDSNGYTPLILAIHNENESLIRLLLDQGAEVNAQSGLALHCAAANGKDSIVSLMLELKAEIDVNDGSNSTPLIQAIRHRQLSTVDLLLRRHASTEVVVGGEVMVTALQVAAYHGCLEVVQLLLERGVNVNVRDRYQETALHNALMSSNENKDIIRRLINAGVDRCAKNTAGFTALDVAAKHGYLHNVQPMIEVERSSNKEEKHWEERAPYINTSLHTAARFGHGSVVQFLLQHVNVNAKDIDGNTALHWAAENGHVAVVQLLLEAGANKDAAENDGWTALHWAVQRDNEAVFQLLLNAGADMNLSDKYGRTALQLALDGRPQSKVLLLCNAKADRNSIEKALQ